MGVCICLCICHFSCDTWEGGDAAAAYSTWCYWNTCRTCALGRISKSTIWECCMHSTNTLVACEVHLYNQRPDVAHTYHSPTYRGKFSCSTNIASIHEPIAICTSKLIVGDMGPVATVWIILQQQLAYRTSRGWACLPACMQLS